MRFSPADTDPVVKSTALDRESRRRARPFAAAALLGLLTAALSPVPAPGFVLAAGLLMALLLACALLFPWAQPPRPPAVLPPLAFLVVVALLRQGHGGSGSGFAPLVMLPVFWVALYGRRWQLAAVLAGVAVLFLLPLTGLLGGEYTRSDARLAILWVLVSALVGFTVQGLVARERAQGRALAAERDRFESVLRASTEYSIIGTDPDGLITVFNRGAERMLGYTAAEMVGRRTPEAFHDPDEVAARAAELGVEPGFAVFVAAARAGAAETRDWTYVRADGARVPVELTVTAIHDSDGEPAGFIGIAADVSAERRAEAALRDSEHRYRTLVEGLPDALIGLYDRELRIVAVDGPMLAKQGLRREDYEGRLLEEALPAENAAALRGPLEAALAGESSSIEYESHLSDTVYEIEALPYEREGEIVGAFTISRDVTRRRRAEAEVRAAEQRFVESFEHAPVGMEMIGLDGRVIGVNPALAALTGRPRAQLVGRPSSVLADPDDPAAEERLRDSLLSGAAERHEVERRIRDASGRPLDVAVHLSLVRGGEGAPRYFVCQVLDISERKRFERELRHVADHDPLTGLLNRRSFAAAMEGLPEREAGQGRGAVLVIDIDGFKQVNDSLGHARGDELIVAVAAALRGRLRESDRVARLGGDEFAVLLPAADREIAELVADNLVDAVRGEEIVVPGRPPRLITISVGVATLGDRAGVDPDAVLTAADFAMYEAKQAGGDRFVLVGPTGADFAREWRDN
jgi:diguanylate cyclase (GGDEF)-like protein/PAS domain S-box-containing protein